MFKVGRCVFLENVSRQCHAALRMPGVGNVGNGRSI